MGGVCAALPFQKLASHQTVIAPQRESEAIEWRSKDFTLEVNPRNQPLTGSHDAQERPNSPAFGGADGVRVNSRAVLDRIAEPPALDGAYQPAGESPLPGANGLRESGGPPPTSGEPADSAPPPTTAPPRSVAITHVIADGDTLEALAEKHLGSRLRWTEIYNANPEILDDPEVLPVGVTIVILPGVRPSTAANIDDAELLVPIRGSDLQKFRAALD